MQSRLLGGAVILAITQLLASLAGLLRDRMLVVTFPGLSVVDVYIAAFRPSDLLFQMLIMSAVGTVLVPMLAKHHAAEDRGEAGKLLGAALTMGCLVFGVVAMVTVGVFPSVAPWLVDFQGEQLGLYVNFARIVLLSDLLMVVGNVTGQYLITIQRYWIYGLTPIVYSLGTIFGTLWLTPWIGPYGPIVGTVCGSILYASWRIAGIFWIGLPLRLQWWHVDVGEMVWLMIPRIFALGAMQIQLLFFDAIGSGIGSGSVTVNAYTRNFQSVVVGIFGIALAQSTFSLLSQTASRGEWGRYRAYLRKSTLMMLALTIPGAFALALLAPVAAWLVHLSTILPVFAMCLTLYAVSIPFESMSHLLFRAYYATKNSSIPAVMSVLGGVSAIVTAWMLADRFGVYALPLGFTLGQLLQVVGLALALPLRLRKLG